METVSKTSKSDYVANFSSEICSSLGLSDNHHSQTASPLNSSNPTENELIDLDDIELSDEDTWLYKSPSKTNEGKDVNPYKWLHKGAENSKNLERQAAKIALICKLEELDILATDSPPKDHISTCKAKDVKHSVKVQDPEDNCDILRSKAVKPMDNGSVISSSNSLECDSRNCEKKSHQPLTQTCSDVSDILKRARQQEESLKESSTKFFNQTIRTFPKEICSSTEYLQSKLQKPNSIEALHVCNGEQNPSSPPTASQRAILSSPSRSPFGSNASLNLPNDVHRGSLPNLNRGYFSLQKKTKRPSESHIQCPLPAYPKPRMIASPREVVRRPLGRGIPKSSSIGESQTLPSSYRAKMKAPTQPSRDFSSSSLARRESTPSPKGLKSLPLMPGPRKESASNVFHETDFHNGKVSQFSPRKNSACDFAESSPYLQGSRTASLTYLPRESNVSTIKESSRPTLQSPLKRQPLSSVQTWESLGGQGDCPAQKKDEGRKSSLTSKIPSPASRSGIPVPSHITSQTNQTNNAWDRNCY